MEEVKYTKIGKMLTTKTMIGLTWKEIIASVVFLFGVFAVWMNLNVRVAAVEAMYIDLQKDIIEMKSEVTDNRNERIDQINQLRNENREEHKAIMESQQRIYDHLLGKTGK